MPSVYTFTRRRWDHSANPGACVGQSSSAKFSQCTHHGRLCKSSSLGIRTPHILPGCEQTFCLECEDHIPKKVVLSRDAISALKALLFKPVISNEHTALFSAKLLRRTVRGEHIFVLDAYINIYRAVEEAVDLARTPSGSSRKTQQWA